MSRVRHTAKSNVPAVLPPTCLLGLFVQRRLGPQILPDDVLETVDPIQLKYCLLLVLCLDHQVDVVRQAGGERLAPVCVRAAFHDCYCSRARFGEVLFHAYALACPSLVHYAYELRDRARGGLETEMR